MAKWSILRLPGNPYLGQAYHPVHPWQDINSIWKRQTFDLRASSYQSSWCQVTQLLNMRQKQLWVMVQLYQMDADQTVKTVLRLSLGQWWMWGSGQENVSRWINLLGKYRVRLDVTDIAIASFTRNCVKCVLRTGLAEPNLLIYPEYTQFTS